MSIGVCFMSLECPLWISWMSVQGLLKVQCIGSSFGIRSFGLFIGSCWQSIRSSVSGVRGGRCCGPFCELVILVL